ncbi:hypothetical protein ASD21_09490 [Caulobacter sp. Root1455]|jgi:hypothetical protein|uniref:hypothetical protein n=1 Tax=unclassified Caulobacter TaxID=2648921 RepID=UPI0006F7803F|nr:MULTISPECIES: hypothetical protein [unclassified Caulobacter]KQY27721.1 hypothetical protein ASD38_17635 [Caulobacter sp. Root487D2Y]KQY93813.1 hypothetical protein ASD21_09490 [Caulobacter sp. Root1455]
MSKDVEQLFRNINQTNIPYREFEPPNVPSPAVGYVELERELTTWADNPAPAAPRSKVFRRYLSSGSVEAQPAAGTALESIFDRMREKCQAATKG